MHVISKFKLMLLKTTLAVNIMSMIFTHIDSTFKVSLIDDSMES